MDPSEQRLLQTYVAQNDDEAFRQLVERHLDMVYHTALRRTGNPALAQDVSQQVFTILARKAKRLKAGSGLGGWLHRTALYESAKMLRSERRRAAKMKELAERQPERSLAPPSDDTLPELDEAIESLPDKDREAIILRFFEGQSFRSMGQSMGKSEDACQKQVSRALVKLNLLLTQRGFAASVAGLTTLLTAESSKAAPAALHQVIASNALAESQALSSAALITHNFATMTLSKTKLVLVVAAISAVPVGFQWKKIQELESQLEVSVPLVEFTAKESAVNALTQRLTAAELNIKKLETENAAHLAAASQEGGKKEASPFSSVAKMFEDPAMQGVLRQQMEGQVKAMFGDLLDSFEFEPKERANLETILIDKLMIAASKGIKAMDQSLSADERKEAAALVESEMNAFDARIREDYGDEIADKVKLYEESSFERQELTAFKSALAQKGLELPFETEEELMAVMYEERKAFDFTHNIQDINDASVLTDLTENTYASIESEYAELHERIGTRVSDILEGESLETFRANQATYLDLLVSSMKMSQQLLGGDK